MSVSAAFSFTSPDFSGLFLWLLIMKNFILLALTSLFLVGCATHTPAPKPSGQLFKINERSLVQPQIQSIQLEASND